MKVELKIDPSCEEPKIIILSDKLTEEITELMKRLSESSHPNILAGFKDDSMQILDDDEIYRIYTADSKVYAELRDTEFLIKQRLYELEERLDNKKFIRISNSEIINLKKVKGFDLSFTGTICVSLVNGVVTYVSRRYMSKLKKVLGV